MIPVARWLISLLCCFLLLIPPFASGNPGLSELLAGSNKAPASDRDTNFLPVEEAFQASGELQGKQVHLTFTIAPGHYLYKERFKLRPAGAEQTLHARLQLPPGKWEYDEFERREVEIFDDTVAGRIELAAAHDFFEMEVTFQGCAKAGLCYPPHTLRLGLAQTSPSAPLPPPGGDTGTVSDLTEESRFAHLLADRSLGTLLVLFFLAGLGLTFTPCVLPMVPILSSIIIGKHQQRPLPRRRALGLTGSYSLGMALTFACAGTLVGYFGAALNLQAKMQSPWVLIPVVLLFCGLALSMFGLYELKLPHVLANRINRINDRQQGGTYNSAVAMGVLSSLVVSPCVSAPLASTLVYISTTGDTLLGGVALFSLGVGMGAPLMLIAMGAHHILPRAGAWMEGIKVVFGVLMLAVSIWLLDRLLPAPLTMGLWAALFICTAIYLGALDLSGRKNRATLTQGVGVMMLVYGSCMLVGAAAGNGNPLKPLSFNLGTTTTADDSTGKPLFLTITHSAELDDLLNAGQQKGKPFFIDFYADWCISCKIFERDVLTQPDIRQLLEHFTRVRVDITANSPDQQKMLNRFNLFGPPAILFFTVTGQELSQSRIYGEIHAGLFRDHLQQVLTVLPGKIAG
jgi:thiol:disulfide interchange protein DsbD